MGVQPIPFELEPDDQPPVPVAADILPPGEFGLAVSRILPADFPLETLLQFVPDVRLKQRVERDAAKALAIDVKADDGPAQLDGALARVRAGLGDILAGFKHPVDLANQLHKRFTGLRADFCKAGEEAVTLGSRRLYDEQKRREQIAADAQRKAQEAADRDAKARAKQALDQAKQAEAPKPVLDALRQQAKTATAAPVASPMPAPTLAQSATVARWKARFRGTPADAEPNPEVAELTESQRAHLHKLVSAIVQGVVPFAAIEINWSYLNTRAAAEKTTLDIPGIETFDAGGLRGKARR